MFMPFKEQHFFNSCANIALGGTKIATAMEKSSRLLLPFDIKQKKRNYKWPFYTSINQKEHYRGQLKNEIEF